MKTVAIALTLSLAVSPVWAQPGQPPDPPPSSQPADRPTDDDAASDVSKLPVSLDRIRRELILKPRSSDDPLRLQYYVQVYGRLPAFALVTERDLLIGGGVQYGSPTHQEILHQITPQQWRSQPADLTALASLIAKWLEGKKK